MIPGRHNMSESFYKYIVDELIVGYFKANPAVSGSRYYVIIENDQYREMFRHAVEKSNNSEEVDLHDLNAGNGLSIEEGHYSTQKLRADAEGAPLLMGYSDTASDDYLNMLRNRVGVEDSRLSDCAIIFVLKNNNMESLTTASVNLESTALPLNSDEIRRNIERHIQDTIVNVREKIYLKVYLDRLSRLIADGMCSLFDFDDILEVLQQDTLKGNFGKLGFFEDETIYLPYFSKTDKEMEIRANDNADFYEKTQKILTNNDERTQKIDKLSEWMDRKVATRIVDADKDKPLSFEDICYGIEKKKQSSLLDIENEYLKNNETGMELVHRKTGSKKHKRYYAIICDVHGTDIACLRLKFNKNVKGLVDNMDNCETNGQYLLLYVVGNMKKRVADDNSEVDIYVVKLQAKETVFSFVSSMFTLNSKGNILLNVPDDETEVVLGNGNTRIDYSDNTPIVWNDDYSLHIPTNIDNDDNKLQLMVQFGATTATFVVSLKSDTVFPLQASALFEKIWTEKISFYKVVRQWAVTDNFEKVRAEKENTEYVVAMSFRKYLAFEQTMISNHAYYLKSEANGFNSDAIPEPVDLDLPENVKACIDAIYEYFAAKNTVPSLAYIDDKLEILYKNYLEALCSCIEQFNKPSMCGSKEYNLTRLGIVEDDDKVCLSPFHPVLVAFMLQFRHSFDNKNFDRKLLRLVSPNNILPFISIDSKIKQPYAVGDDVKTWLFYDNVDDKNQIRSGDVTPTVVCDKMLDFIRHFDYLFRDKDCPLIINVVGVKNDTNVIKGVLQFIEKQLIDGQVQRVNLNEYVDNLLSESFFEKLNRLGEDDKRIEELGNIDFKIGYASKEGDSNADIKAVIHQLFTRVKFYKHKLGGEVKYSHITFFEFNTGKEFGKPNTDTLRLEMAFDGMIANVSTQKLDNYYYIGFGTKGLDAKDWIYRTAKAMNTLYANEEDKGTCSLVKNSCIAKKLDFTSPKLLNSIYKNSNWVTFLNPEVDIDFFYKQKDLYIIHYLDQSTITARYDSITVTEQIDQYKNMIRTPYKAFSLPEGDFNRFNQTMLSYFNCLNGSWLLNVIREPEVKIREKMSIVAACILMKQFVKRVKDVVWIPISLEEILRVTGSIRLPMESLFSKKSLGITGMLSDDLLMMGLDDSVKDDIKLYFYPVEVKYSNSSSAVKIGETQVEKTYKVFKDNIIDDKGFRRNIYATFFASQFLTNADKFNANGLLSPKEKSRIDNCRYKLLNLKFSVPEHVPVNDLGNAAIVRFTDTSQRQLFLRNIEDVSVCHIYLSEKECYQWVAEETGELKHFVYNDEIEEKTNEYDEDNENEDVHHDEPEAKQTKDDLNIAAKKPGQFTAYYGPMPENLKVNNNDTKNNESESKDEHNNGPIGFESPIKVIVGSSKVTGKEVCFEPNDTKKLSHPNMGIIGTMGTGKTQLARSIIAQLSKEGEHNVGKRPIGVLVFDYKGDYNGKDFLERVDGKCYRTNFPFNPFKLIAVPGLEGVNLPAVTADTISDSFAKAYNLGVKQKSHIKDVIKDVYNDYGITADPSTWSRPVPTLNDVIESYFEKYDAKDSVYALFSSLNDYSIFTNDNSNCVSIFEWLQGVRVIDLTIFPDDTKRVIVSLILDLFYSEMKKLGASRTSGRYRELRAMIMVDEAHQFLSKEFNSLRRIISEGRMFGVGMILSTQNLSDFKSSHEDYSQYILSWAIHHVNSISKSELASVFGASDPHWQDYMDFINRAEIFQSICKLGSRVDGIRDLPYFELLKKDPRFEK